MSSTNYIMNDSIQSKIEVSGSFKCEAIVDGIRCTTMVPFDGKNQCRFCAVSSTCIDHITKCPYHINKDSTKCKFLYCPQCLLYWTTCMKCDSKKCASYMTKCDKCHSVKCDRCTDKNIYKKYNSIKFESPYSKPIIVSKLRTYNTKTICDDCKKNILEKYNH